MNILITGSSGLVGSHLMSHVRTLGHRAMGLDRTSSRSVIPRWQPTQNEIVLPTPNPFNGVVHLAGHPIACRWTESNKRKIRESRARGTQLLAHALATADPLPRVLVSASATGFFGDRGDEWLEETSPAGRGFLPEVAQGWEAATQEAEDAGIRVVHLRFGIVLSPGGGALATMLPIFRWGAGGRIGSGKQFWSWITLPDLLNVIAFSLQSESLSGPFNAVSPHPVTNQEFTKQLGKALHRPAFLPVPKIAAKLAMGEMAEEALLASTRVRPRRLLDAGFHFQHPDLSSAFGNLLPTG